MHSRQLVDFCKSQVLLYLDSPTQGSTFGHLMAVCNLSEGLRTADGVTESRVMDRALKSLRGDGKIEFVDRVWRKVAR